MTDPSLLGQIALDHKVITENQLHEALEHQKQHPGMPLGTILVDKGYLDSATLQVLLSAQLRRLEEKAAFSNLKKKEYLFGRIAVDYGFATPEQVNECLRIQAELSKYFPMRLGEVLVQRGYITPEAVHTLLDIQNQKILFCKRCRAQFNVAGWQPQQDMKCPQCGETLAVPDTVQIQAERTTLVNEAGLQLELAVAGAAGPEPGRPAADVGSGRRAEAAAGLEAAAGAEAAAAAEAGAPPPAGLPADAASERAGTPQPAVPTIKGTWIGNYELIRRIASGPRCTVYKAWSPANRRLLAIKVMADSGAETGTAPVGAGPEVPAPPRLRHAAIVKILEVGIEAGRRFVAMEYIQGLTLRELAARERLAPERALGILKTVAEGIQYAHRKGVLHRNLKPENILIDTHGEARVSDFGAAQEAPGNASAAAREATALTAAYLAPEQGRGQPADVRADVYALGACLFEALTGRPPYLADTASRVLEKAQSGPPPSPRAFAPRVPVEVDHIVRKAMSPRPDDRQASVQEFVDEIEHYLQGQPVAGIGVARRPLARYVGIALCGAGLLALAFALFWRQGGDTARVWIAPSVVPVRSPLR